MLFYFQEHASSRVSLLLVENLNQCVLFNFVIAGGRHSSTGFQHARRHDEHAAHWPQEVIQGGILDQDFRKRAIDADGTPRIPA